MTPHLIHDDCLVALRQIADEAVDMILADLPYGMTPLDWDNIIPMSTLWPEMERVCKGRIVMFASQPFTSLLVASNISAYQHSWVWDKKFAGNFAVAKYVPLKIHEDILVFKKGPYYPQMETRDVPIKLGKNAAQAWLNNPSEKLDKKIYTQKFPSSILSFSSRSEKRGFHPTQKPVALLEYLIRTYTKDGDLVLDPTMGSGSTGVACRNLKRRFIGIEKEANYFQIAEQRILKQLSEDSAKSTTERTNQ